MFFIVATGIYLVTTATAETPPELGLWASMVASAFDPAWNVANRFTLWTMIVVVLFLSGIGFPLPEDVPLTLAGFTTYKQANDVFVFSHYVRTFLMGCTPILLGDILAYTLGKRFGLTLRERFRVIRYLVNDQRLARVENWFKHYGSFTVFLGRQVAGVRFVTFFTSGSMKVPLLHFVFFDFLGCLVSIPVWLTLGTLASRYGQVWLKAAMHKVSGIFIVVTLAAFVGLFLFAKIRGQKKAKAAASSAPVSEDGSKT